MHAGPPGRNPVAKPTAVAGTTAAAAAVTACKSGSTAKAAAAAAGSSRPTSQPVGGRERGPASLPWTDKHSPATEEQLAMHKRKVSDFRDWLEHQLHRIRNPLPGPRPSHMIVATGEHGWGLSVLQRCRRGLQLQLPYLRTHHSRRTDSHSLTLTHSHSLTLTLTHSCRTLFRTYHQGRRQDVLCVKAGGRVGGAAPGSTASVCTT